MAKKSTIKQEDINKICLHIVGTGEEPTLATVRENLGGKGSFSTIQPLLKIWKDESKENADLPPIPEKLEYDAITAATECWKFAVKLNRKEIASLKTIHAQEIEETNKQLKDSLAMLDKETEKNEELTTIKHNLEKANKEIETKNSRSLGRIEELEKIIAKNEPRLPDFQQKKKTPTKSTKQKEKPLTPAEEIADKFS